MCRIASVTLPGDRRAAGAGRRFVSDRLGHWGLADAADTAILLTSEVTANAAVHAGGPIDLRVVVSDGSVEIAVRDSSTRLPRTRHRTGGAGPDAGAGPDTGARLDDGTGLYADAVDEPEEGWMVESGRGLRIVEALADEWGVAELADGKQVWFRLSTEPGASTTVACTCSPPGSYGAGRRPGVGVALGSGRWAVDTSPS